MTVPADLQARAALRTRLRLQRETWVCQPGFAEAKSALGGYLTQAIQTLRPRCLGGYWPLPGEFNPWEVLLDGSVREGLALALPWACRQPRHMVYQHWDGAEPERRDEFGIPSAQGGECVPDVVLAPCLGYTRTGWRLGYGGGFFDRYLALHPQVVALGIAWACTEIGAEDFVPTPHDRRMSWLLTERGATQV